MSNGEVPVDRVTAAMAFAMEQFERLFARPQEMHRSVCQYQFKKYSILIIIHCFLMLARYIRAP